MSKTKKENNQPSKYQELNNFELEIICGGSTTTLCSDSGVNAKDFIPESASFTKSEGG